MLICFYIILLFCCPDYFLKNTGRHCSVLRLHWTSAHARQIIESTVFFFFFCCKLAPVVTVAEKATIATFRKVYTTTPSSFCTFHQMNGILVSHLDETVPIARVVCRAKSSELTFFGAKFFQPHFLPSFTAPIKSWKRPCHNQTLPLHTHIRRRRGSSKLLGKWDQISATQYRATYPDGRMVQRTMRNDMVMMPWGRTKSGINVRTSGCEKTASMSTKRDGIKTW